MLVKDEGDVVLHTVLHLLEQVDEVLALDNLSTDGTSEILRDLAREHDELHVDSDDEVGYFQSQKTTALAQQALARGHEWVVPCDADEVWFSPFGRLGDVLSELDGDWLFATAALYDHIGTHDDPPYANPLERIGWRFLEPGKLPKVAARTHRSLEIEMGNHGASMVAPGRVRSNGSPPTMTGRLQIRHFSWRSEDQYLRKITNGYRAYAAAPDLKPYGEHWKMFGAPESEAFDDRVRAHFRRWFYVADLRDRVDLIYDPAPLGAREE